MDRTKSEALWTREFLGMSLSNFLIYITQYAMIAALPIVIMTEYGGGDVEAGLAMTFFQIGTVTARPFAGILIDAVNKRHLMIAITVAFFLVMTAFAFAAALSALYGLRLLHGVIFAVATTTAAALVALVLPPARKGEGIGYFALSTNLAMVVGPMIGLLLMEHSSATTLFVALSILAAISIAAGGFPTRSSSHKKRLDAHFPSVRSSSGAPLPPHLSQAFSSSPTAASSPSSRSIRAASGYPLRQASSTRALRVPFS